MSDTEANLTAGHTDARRERLRAIVRERVDDAGGIVVSSATNVGYLTGFTGDSSVLVLTRDRQIVVSDGRYDTQLELECPELERHIRPRGQPLYSGVAEVVSGLGPGSFAFEAAHVSVADRESLGEKSPTIQWRGVIGWVERLRAIKDDLEISRIRESIAIAEDAYQRLRSSLRASLGVTEKRAADDLESLMRQGGATGPAFPLIVAVAGNAALPHARPSPRARIEADSFILIDWGATAQAYRSDLTRMVVTGMFTPKFKQVYQSVLAAQDCAISAIHPGRTAREVDTMARRVLEEAGFGECFNHGLGHGIGLEIHEMPFLSREPDLKLEAGMVLTVEPGVYLPGWGGVRIEDDVLVTEDGAEVLTHLPKELDAVGLDG